MGNIQDYKNKNNIKIEMFQFQNITPGDTFTIVHGGMVLYITCNYYMI